MSKVENITLLLLLILINCMELLKWQLSLFLNIHIMPLYFLFTKKNKNCQAPIAQSVALRAVNVNPWVASLINSSAKNLSYPWQRSFVFHQWANSRRAASCLEKMLCWILVWESQETHEKVNWLPWIKWWTSMIFISGTDFA